MTARTAGGWPDAGGGTGGGMDVLAVDDWEITIKDSDLHLRLDHVPGETWST